MSTRASTIRRRFRTSATLLPSLLALAVAACHGEAPAGPKQRPPPLVTSAQVTVRDVPLEISSPVELRPFVQADVGSKQVGYLDAVLVDRGDRVRAGQVLALVRPSDLPDQLAAARGTLAQTQASVALARANKERAEALAPTGRISQQELEQARAQLATAEASQTAATSQASGLAVRLGETKIVAPFDGVVLVRKLDPGALVGPGTGAGGVLTLVKVDTLRANVTVNERDVRGLAMGLAAHVEMDALPGRSFKGQVTRIAPAFDPTTRTIDAEVRLANQSGELRPGMYGKGALVVGVHKDALVVPVHAVQISNKRKFVFVLDGDKVHRKEIETGVDGGDWLEVTSGLQAGAEIVTAGADALSEGAQVRAAKGVDPFTGQPAAQQPKPARPAD